MDGSLNDGSDDEAILASVFYSEATTSGLNDGSDCDDDLHFPFDCRIIYLLCLELGSLVSRDPQRGLRDRTPAPPPPPYAVAPSVSSEATMARGEQAATGIYLFIIQV